MNNDFTSSILESADNVTTYIPEQFYFIEKFDNNVHFSEYNDFFSFGNKKYDLSDYKSFLKDFSFAIVENGVRNLINQIISVFKVVFNGFISKNYPNVSMSNIMVSKMNTIQSPMNCMNRLELENFYFDVTTYWKNDTTIFGVSINIEKFRLFMSIPESSLVHQILDSEHSKLFIDVYNEIIKEMENVKVRKSDLSLLIVDILKELINYRKKVKNNYWIKTKDFDKEKVFREDLFNYLGEEGRFPDRVVEEVRIGKGIDDIYIIGLNGKENIPLELKLIDNKVEYKHQIPKNIPQITQYCSGCNSKFGFLIYLETFTQTGSENPDFNDFAVVIPPDSILEGLNVKEKIIIIVIRIHGGQKINPSEL